MGLRKTATCGLLALSTLAVVACQKPATDATSNAASANAFETGSLRAVVIGDGLPMITKEGDTYDGLSMVVLEASNTTIDKPS